jgi:hypothetical protein
VRFCALRKASRPLASGVAQQGEIHMQGASIVDRVRNILDRTERVTCSARERDLIIRAFIASWRAILSGVASASFKGGL